ncbi:unnamed protein product [Mycena citricolor]|uniref:Short-chain dehydrogenase n=1 Tax=Mycena citricolor TaxID=2018698 RepID=A0AAD2Q1Z2_9AGAR|nr:unnamed protein product [Mycena citricolor]
MSYPTFNFHTTAEDVATAFSDEIKGKNVLITGTSINGIGFETARAIAKYANLVVITGHNEERLRLAEAAIKKEVPHANIRALILDLSSFVAVRTAATEVNAYEEPIHVLINNAAAPLGPFKLTVDGLENQIATDHLGPFLLTALIAPKLLAARTEQFTPRVVFVSSHAHILCKGPDFETLRKPDPDTYQAFNAYAHSKSANVLTAAELSRRSHGKLNGYSLHPGEIPTNLLLKEESLETIKSQGILGPDGQPNTRDFHWKTIPEGAATTVVAAFDPRLAASPGAYLDNSVVANEKIEEHSADPANAAKLWDLSEEIVEVKFTFEL